MRPLTRRVVKLESLRRADGDVFHLTWRLPGEPEPEVEEGRHCFVWEGKGQPPAPRWTTTAKLPKEEFDFIKTQILVEIKPTRQRRPLMPEEDETLRRMTNVELVNVLLTNR